jgi:hypothetical protein
MKNFVFRLDSTSTELWVSIYLGVGIWADSIVVERAHGKSYLKFASEFVNQLCNETYGILTNQNRKVKVK